MCVKFPLGNLNFGFRPPHPTSTYTCGVTITPRMYGSVTILFFNSSLVGIENIVVE